MKFQTQPALVCFMFHLVGFAESCVHLSHKVCPCFASFSFYGLSRELCSPSHIACSCSLHFSPCWLSRALYSPSHTTQPDSISAKHLPSLRGVGKLSSVSPGFTSSKVASLLSQIVLCFSLRFSFMLPLP